MTKTDIIVLTIIIIITILFSFVATSADKYMKNGCGIKIPVSERITACEEKGGKYNLYWNKYSNEYYERCEIVEDEIKEF